MGNTLPPPPRVCPRPCCAVGRAIIPTAGATGAFQTTIQSTLPAPPPSPASPAPAAQPPAPEQAPPAAEEAAGSAQSRIDRQQQLQAAVADALAPSQQQGLQHAAPPPGPAAEQPLAGPVPLPAPVAEPAAPTLSTEQAAAVALAPLLAAGLVQHLQAGPAAEEDSALKSQTVTLLPEGQEDILPVAEEAVAAPSAEEAVAAPAAEQAVVAPAAEQAVAAPAAEQPASAPTTEGSLFGPAPEQAPAPSLEEVLAALQAPAVAPPADPAAAPESPASDDGGSGATVGIAAGVAGGVAAALLGALWGWGVLQAVASACRRAQAAQRGCLLCSFSLPPCFPRSHLLCMPVQSRGWPGTGSPAVASAPPPPAPPPALNLARCTGGRLCRARRTAASRAGCWSFL